ncbi:hypothetical protein RF683_05095 [Flavobacterium sp. 20NA77.7]|uniref:Uncharacterized protein n=1 Tax=Flavobacterium nakdongensis TaxID=3073563 RepID=A0ABY9RF25_9FLAO|nr:hypothetical protein [Flavobacterium sp. 20NA77.7]WMW78822.1 hypothetical protein RF683_05095 [Flavobacterium sp. 20NA77.7]
MKQNSQHIKQGFKIPDNYFETFSTRLEAKLDTDSILEYAPSTAGFNVPDAYFTDFETRLYSKLQPKETPIFKLSVNKYWVSGIAALFLLSIMLPIFYHTQEVKQTNEAAKEYLEIHADELSTYEVGILLQDSEIEDLENELIYNNI